MRLSGITPVAGAIVVALLMVGCGPGGGAGEQPLAATGPLTGQALDFANFRGAHRLNSARAPLVEQAPVIDGRMDEAYRACEPMQFAFLKNPGAPRARTTARVLCTGQALYLFFDCAAVTPVGAVGTKTQHDSDLWEENNVESFLDPSGTGGGRYFQVAVNPLGTLADSITKDAKAWNPTLQAATSVTPGGWTAELAIPFAELGVKPGTANKVWRMNLTRLSADTREDTSWCVLGGYTSHVPERFGYLWVDAGGVLNVPPQDMVPWRELFNGKDLSGWTIRPGGKVAVQDGMLVTGPADRATLLLNQPVQEEEYAIALDTVFVGQQRFLFARDGDNRRLGWFAAFINPINEMNVALMRDWEFYVNPYGFHGTILDYTGGRIEDGTWYRLEVQVRRRHVVMLMDGRICLDVANPYPDARHVGIKLDASAKVKNVQIRRLVPEKQP